MELMGSSFAEWLEEQVAADPELAGAMEEARLWHERAESFVCPRGCCESQLAPGDEERMSGVGPVDCPHADDSIRAVRETWRKV